MTITLEPDGDGTLLTVMHEGFVDDRARDDHMQAWNDCLGRLPGFGYTDRNATTAL